MGRERVDALQKQYAKLYDRYPRGPKANQVLWLEEKIKEKEAAAGPVRCQMSSNSQDSDTEPQPKKAKLDPRQAHVVGGGGAICGPAGQATAQATPITSGAGGQGHGSGIQLVPADGSAGVSIGDAELAYLPTVQHALQNETSNSSSFELQAVGGEALADAVLLLRLQIRCAPRGFEIAAHTTVQSRNVISAGLTTDCCFTPRVQHDGTGRFCRCRSGARSEAARANPALPSIDRTRLPPVDSIRSYNRSSGNADRAPVARYRYTVRRGRVGSTKPNIGVVELRRCVVGGSAD